MVPKFGTGRGQIWGGGLRHPICYSLQLVADGRQLQMTALSNKYSKISRTNKVCEQKVVLWWFLFTAVILKFWSFSNCAFFEINLRNKNKILSCWLKQDVGQWVNREDSTKQCKSILPSKFWIIFFVMWQLSLEDPWYSMVVPWWGHD